MAAEEDLVKRTLPYDMDAEQSVIGCMLVKPDVIASAAAILREEDFYIKQYGMVFQAMVELNDAGKGVDPITVQDKLREKGAPPEVSSLEYVKDIMLLPIGTQRAEDYAEIVASKAVLRRLIKACDEIANACYAGTNGLKAILEDAEKKIFNIVQYRGVNSFTPIRQIVLSAMSRIEQASKMKGNVTGVATGFLDLDYKTAGMQPADLILIAARPSMGKSALMLNIAQHVAFKCDLPIAVFSLEMSREQLVNRLFSLESRVDSQHIRTGNLTDGEWLDLIDGASTVGRSKLIIDDTPAISISELRSKCRKFKLEQDIRMVIIDYLQLMSGSGKGGRFDSRQQEVSEISRSLKALARELNVPVIALSQLSRAVEQRPDRKPMLSDLRESGAIEQDADVVMFIYRDDYYNKDSEKKGIAEIIIAKQRNGPIGTVELVWLPDYTKFESIKH